MVIVVIVDQLIANMVGEGSKSSYTTLSADHMSWTSAASCNCSN